MQNQSQTGAIFISWPFGSYVAQNDQMLALRYHTALCNEIELFCSGNEKCPLRVMYIGGELAGEYPHQLLLDMAGILNRNFCVSADAEVTIEAGSSVVRSDQVTGWHLAGVNRVCLRVPSVDCCGKAWQLVKNDERERIERVSDVIQNVAVEIQMGSQLHDWLTMIDDLVTWPIQGISVYFGNEKCTEDGVCQSEHLQPAQVYIDAIARLKSAQFQQHGIYDFARAGYVTRFNDVYSNRLPYRGFGVGACSYHDGTRIQNVTDVIEYCQQIERGESAVGLREVLTPDQVVFEKVMLGLSRVEGLKWYDLLQAVSSEQKMHMEKIRTQLQEVGLMGFDGHLAWLTPEGFLVHNQIVTKLLLEIEE